MYILHMLIYILDMCRTSCKSYYSLHGYGTRRRWFNSNRELYFFGTNWLRWKLCSGGPI